VIVPARDAEQTLPRVLEAIAGQELDGGFELIVVDNGSLDATAQIAAEAEGVNVVVRRERGQGPGAARNAGAAAARGRVLAFLDSDCWPAPGWLSAGVLATEEWVLHAADQDLPCLAEIGLRPSQLYDTELAGRLAGYERVNLAAMVQRIRQFAATLAGRNP